MSENLQLSSHCCCCCCRNLGGTSHLLCFATSITATFLCSFLFVLSVCQLSPPYQWSSQSVSFSAAFYFHAAEREEKCIIEDIPSDTLVSASNKSYMFVTGTFKIQQWDMDRHDFLESAPGLGMFVTITTYKDEVLLSKLYGAQGTFYFTSHSPGEHIICLESNSTRLVSFGGSKLRIHLDIRVGEHDLDAAIAQAKDKVNEVTFKLQHLIEQTEQIIKEQNFQRDREENFRMTSEDTNRNVLWWAFAQILIFISVGIFQMKYLKNFFIAKKLV